MAKNALEPGAAGVPAPRPGDAEANSLTMTARPSEMMTAFGSEQDAAAAQFEKLKEALAHVTATRKALDKLMLLRDTVTTDDVVEAAGDIVAAGIGANEVASLLADMPQSGPQLQAWVAQQDAAVREREAQVASAVAQGRYQLGLSGLMSILAASAEQHQMNERRTA